MNGNAAQHRLNPEAGSRRSQVAAGWPGALVLVMIVLWLVGGFVPARAGQLALVEAAQRKDWAQVTRLLAASPDVNAAQADGTTALHWATEGDDLRTVQALLAAGADVAATNRYGVASLSLACANGNTAVVRALLEAGADPNTTLRGGETVLLTAARTGRVEPLQMLLKRGARLDATDHKGQTALMWAAAEGHARAVEVLLAAGADRQQRLGSGFTAFLFAVRNGRLEAVRTLLRAGCDAGETIVTEKGGGRLPENGTSALLLAVQNGHYELAIELVNAGANPNEQPTGATPLHALIPVRKPSRGDDISGQPPPEGSGQLTSLEFVRAIVACGADVNAALGSGEQRPGRLNRNGATPFLLAAQTADLELMKLLVELGADCTRTNVDGVTPLLAAAGLGCFAPTEEAGTEVECLAAAEYLLSLGADVNAVTQTGETAMHGAAYKSLPRMVRFLTERGAKVGVWNHKNKSGWTPVLIAEGYRPGNFKPSVETLEALYAVMRAAGVTPPPPRARPDPAAAPKGYLSSQ